MSDDNFHHPMGPSHGDGGGDDGGYVPFKRGQMKPFKKQLKKYSDDNGYTEAAKKQWRGGDRRRNTADGGLGD